MGKMQSHGELNYIKYSKRKNCSKILPILPALPLKGHNSQRHALLRGLWFVTTPHTWQTLTTLLKALPS